MSSVALINPILQLQPESLRDSVDEVEVRRDRSEIVDARIAQTRVAQRGNVIETHHSRRERELQRVIDEDARPRVQWSRARIGAQLVDQRVLAGDPPQRRSMMRDSIEAVVRAGHRDSNGLPLRARQLRLAEHHFAI